MTVPRPRRRRIRRAVDLGAGLLATALVVLLVLTGAGGLPPLGAAFNPGTGVWHLADAGSADLTLPGLHGAASVGFESDGIAHVKTADDGDLWRVIGYTHAKFRLFQMDLMRRQGEGTLAEVLGPDMVESDEFELDLGLRRAAERDWAQMPAGETRDTLIAYSDGVNAALDQLVADDALPTPIKLAGYVPAHWTPVDTLVLQRQLAQNLSFSQDALTFAHAKDALGASTFAALFPTIPANRQYPYDPGPYQALPLAPAPVRADAAPLRTAGDEAPGGVAPASFHGGNAGVTPLLNRIAKLPAGEVHDFGASNAWVVSGARTASGGPLLAADPHLDFSLPSIWYQLEGDSPGFHFAGPTIPGVPVPLMGRTDSVSWGITNAQHPTTLYYLEQTDPARPGQYYWRGAWHRTDTVDYTIAVKDAPAVHHTVSLTAHGPIMQIEDRTVSVWWAGTLPSDNITDVLNLLRAKDFTSFRASLRTWATPAVNFVFADAKGDIGAFDVGVAPQVKGHDISLPLPGDGSADVSGAIPFDALPHAANPPSGLLASANQREVSADYPYQYSTSYNFVDQGWRATEINQTLGAATKLTADDFRRLQGSRHDPLAVQLSAAVLSAVKGTSLSPQERQVTDLLARWDGTMAEDSAAATVFENLEDHLAYLALKPNWHGPAVAGDEVLPPPFDTTPATPIVTGTVLGWFAQNPSASPIGDLTALLRRTFTETVAHLGQTSGADPAGWAYGKHHSVVFQSLLGASPLNDGPYPSGGDAQTVNAAVGALHDGDKVLNDVTTGGASWRFVLDWGTGQAASAYPGGQSEDPLSPWYDNLLAEWRAGRLSPMSYGRADAAATTWRFTR
ncbi:penicillin acylase family protein [Amycolatopsis sp. NPDC047767]|uniref:penicillin acylase family protein n=1 Tax=Amycolatopsis sp. NPDC047767 TaxID=3156765 RepID=UPI0034568FF9